MNRRFTLQAVLAGTLLLGACAVGPKPAAPVAIPAPSRGPDSLTSHAAGMFIDSLTRARLADTVGSVIETLRKPAPLELDSTGAAWLRIMGDTTLEALVRTAVSNNRDLRAAEGRVREYRATFGVARGDLFPQLSANGTASTNQAVFGAFPPQKFDALRVTADLSWELDFWGKLRRQSQAAQLDWRGREADRRAVLITLVSDVVEAYLDLRQLDAELSIAERTLASRQSTLRLAEERFKQGVISELDVRQFEAEAAVPAASVADFARRRAQKENALSLLLGQEPGPIARGRPLESVVQSVQMPDSIPGELLGKRPDVLGAELAYEAATARIGIAIGSKLPKFTVTGQYGTQSPDLSGLFGSNHELYSLQGGISVPLFTGGKNTSQVRAARARADQARAAYEQTVLRAAQETSDALVGLHLNRDQLGAQATQVQALVRALELANKRYQSGVSSYLEVLDAERGLFGAELALVSVQRQYLGSTVQLYKAIGANW